MGTTVRTRSQCGCVTAFLVLLVLAIPAASFGTAGAVLAYTFLGLLVLAGVSYQIRQTRHRPAVPAPTPTPPPPGRG